jgi:hypothetical protein
MARLLNQGVLPSGYYAVPFIDHDGPVEIDVAALKEKDATDARATSTQWSPESPALAVAIDPPIFDSVRVDVMTDDGDPRLAAAIELVSPRNKDRATARQAFAAKCASVVQHGSGLVVVDAVTTRRSDLHAPIMIALGAANAEYGPSDPSAISYRATMSNGEAEVQVWMSPLVVGKPLPTVPLWIASDLAVPLDLEASHAAACEDVRIRPAS